MTFKQPAFDWEIYNDGFTGNHKLLPNLKIKGSNLENKCFSREKYAQKLFDAYTGTSNLVKKDVKKGDCVSITDIYNVKETTMDIEISGGLSINIDLTREKKFLQIFGYNDVIKFTTDLLNRDYVKKLLEQNLLAYIIESSPSLKISLWQGYLAYIRSEFMDQISNPSKAYTCKIKEANKGGFFVELQGIDAFMPGSLAAPNKINDFQSYIGKEIVVMIEDYLTTMNSFIVSHKKYISHILPQKLSQIDLSFKYTGNITGTSKYGVFIEFDEFFTGLLHVSKMTDETKLKFEKREFNPGDKIEFYVSEITKDNRVILTEENPEEKFKKIQQFIVESKDKVVESRIAAIMNFGAIIDINDIVGLVPLKEFKKQRIFINNYIVNDKLNVIFEEYKDGKLLFSLPEIKYKSKS